MTIETSYRARKMQLARLDGTGKVAEWMRIYGRMGRRGSGGHVVPQVPVTRTGEVAYDRVVAQVLDAEFPAGPPCTCPVGPADPAECAAHPGKLPAAGQRNIVSLSPRPATDLELPA